MGAACATKLGDHAGSLIASMAIDLATKSSPEFEYTNERSSCIFRLFEDVSTFAPLFGESTRCERESAYYKVNLQKRGKIVSFSLCLVLIIFSLYKFFQKFQILLDNILTRA